MTRGLCYALLAWAIKDRPSDDDSTLVQRCTKLTREMFQAFDHSTSYPSGSSPELDELQFENVPGISQAELEEIQADMITS